MSDSKKIDVLFGADALAHLNRKTLQQLAEASERNYIRSEGELPQAIAAWHERMRNVLEQQQVAVVTIGDEQEVVSMAGFELLGKTSDGRPVYEAGRSVTLQEHRKKGYYRQVMERVVEAIRQKSPNAVIVRSTQIDTVEKSCREMGFQSIPPARYVQYKGGEQWENLSERERQGYADWQYFELDLMRSPS